MLKLNTSGGAALLQLRNYSGFNTLKVFGLDGADTFDVFTGPSAGRDVFIDGGIPSGKRKLTDVLNVWYVAPRPAIVHSAATQNPDAGLVDLDYGTSSSLIQYVEIEKVVIARV